MDAQAWSAEDRARFDRERAAGQAVLNAVAGMDAEEGITAIALAMASVCAGIAQDAGGSPESAADLVRRMLGCAEREARRQFGRVKRAPMGRH